MYEEWQTEQNKTVSYGSQCLATLTNTFNYVSLDINTAWFPLVKENIDKTVYQAETPHYCL